MKHLFPTVLCCSLAATQATGQNRYFNEVFTDTEIVVTNGVPYGSQIDLLTSNLDPTACPTVPAELTQLHTLAAMGQPFPAMYYDPTDPGSCVKLMLLKQDVYMPDPTVDPVAQRPVVVYLHTGNLLPPCINTTPVGSRSDSVAVEICRNMARRGYVAISIDYSLGWNPLLVETDLVAARAQLLTAVYRALMDLRAQLRSLRAEAAGADPWGIDPDKVIVMGEGTGSYIALSSATLDDASELYTPSLLCDPFNNISCIDTTRWGNVQGFGGMLNLHQPNGFNSSVQFCVNLGGALPDSTWIEAGDAPMVSVHTVRDDHAPFTQGFVYVSTSTPFPVIEVFGSNSIIRRANMLGNNDAFRLLPTFNPWTTPPHFDVYTDRARSLYGTSWSSLCDGTPCTQVIADSLLSEGLFPVIRPQYSFLQNESQPWQWWDCGSYPGNCEVVPGVTACDVAASTNPFSGPTQGRAFVDTIMGYANPRIVCALQLGPCPHVGTQEPTVTLNVDIHPNPATDQVNVICDQQRVTHFQLHDMSGRVVREASVNANRFTIARQDLTPGVYFLRLYTSTGDAVRKLVLD